mgnify:CR=1 FL=1
MRTECLRSRYLYGRPLPVQRLVSAVGDSTFSLTFLWKKKKIKKSTILQLFKS